MRDERKFWVTSNRSIDIEIVGDVEYLPAGEDGRKEAELYIDFKWREKQPIHLSGDEADRAWKNYQKALDPSIGAMEMLAKAMAQRPNS